MSATRGSADFKTSEYDALVEKMRNLHEALSVIKSRKTKQRTKFPNSFHDAFGVLVELEKKRLKFAKFCVRASGGQDCRTLADKREMRDQLESIITHWCAKRAKNLAPIDDSDKYEKLLACKRQKK
jgi:hypothetical protein